MKKRWILVPVAIAMMAIGVLTTGAVLAHTTGTDGDSAVGSFASRVASILGIEDASQVQDAMDQARRELKDEAIQSKLNTMVEEGRIAQEQADAYFEWYRSRPNDFPGFGPRRGFGRPHGFGHGMNGFHPKAPPADNSQSVDATTTL